MIPDKHAEHQPGRDYRAGVAELSADRNSFANAILQALAKEYHFDLDTPFEEYPQKIQDILLHGTEWQGGSGLL